MWRKQTNSYSILLFLLVIGLALPVESHGHDLSLLTFVDAPYVYPESANKQGLAVLFIKQLMARANLAYSLEVVPAKRALLIASENPNTCVFPIERSQEREVQFSWVSPILISQHGFFKRPDNNLEPLRTVRDAQKYSIGTYLGSGIGEYLRNLDFTVKETTSDELNIRKLFAKRIDLWASDILSAQYMAKKNDLILREPELIFFTSLRAMACHSSLSDKILQRLNQTLVSMYKDGSIERIRKNFKL